MKVPANLRRKVVASLMVPAFALAGAVPSWAAGDSAGKTTGAYQSDRSDRMTHPTRASFQDMRASELIGKQVRNQQGEDLGEIDDVIIDVNNDKVHYAVLAFGGIAGLGEKLFAYPVKTFKTGTRGDELVLAVDEQRLEKAPGFDRNRWPDWSRDEYRGEVDRYFGPTVQVESKPDQQLVRASELIGKNVDDARGQEAGELKDFVVNMEDGSVKHAVLDINDSWGDGKNDQLLILPLDDFKFPRTGDGDIALAVPRNQVDTSRAIPEERWSRDGGGTTGSGMNQPTGTRSEG